MRYRKLPVEIEAVQFIKGDNGTFYALGNIGLKPVTDSNGDLIIDTLEGQMRATDGDYIIKGVNGEFYPCKPEIFEKTYELIGVDKCI